MNRNATIPKSKKYTSALNRIRDNSLREYENYNSIISFVEIFNDNVDFLKLDIVNKQNFNIYADEFTKVDFNSIKQYLNLYSEYTAMFSSTKRISIYTETSINKRISYDLYRRLINSLRYYMEEVHAIILPNSFIPTSLNSSKDKE